jgi:predicted homoserine dehydrogenase-like protein
MPCWRIWGGRGVCQLKVWRLAAAGIIRGLVGCCWLWWRNTLPLAASARCAPMFCLTAMAQGRGLQTHSHRSDRLGRDGTDIVTRVAHMTGIEIGAIAELNPMNATKAVDIACQEKGHPREATGSDAINAAIEAGIIAITSDAGALLNSGLIDVVIDATGVPAIGAEIGLRAMEHGKHLMMTNVEAAATIDAHLKAQADRLGATCSLGAGNEPSFCMDLIEFVSPKGHKIMAAGKGKNNPLNIDAAPPHPRKRSPAGT